MGTIIATRDIVLTNANFRKILYTKIDENNHGTQMVAMTIDVNEDIGVEIHDNTLQILTIELGAGIVTLDNRDQKVIAGTTIIVPRAVKHNIFNNGLIPMKILTTYYGEILHDHDG